MKNTSWKLTSFQVDFKKGYEWEKEDGKKVDRYEGEVTFENGISEKFTVKLDATKCMVILELLSNQIVNTAQSLADKLRQDLTEVQS